MSSAFLNAMDSTDRVLGENGAAAHTSTDSKLVDLFFQLVRGLDRAALAESFRKAAAAAKTLEEKADLVVLAFQTRSCRSDSGAGKGEKQLFYVLLAEIAKVLGAEVVTAVLPLVSGYGYYKDLLALNEHVPESVAEASLALFDEALKADERELSAATKEKRTPKLSLAGKWAPRENSAFDKKMKLATKLALKMYGSANKPQAQRKYRKLIASLNAALNTTEVLMAAGRWEEVKFAAVASKCLQVHRKAFLNEKVKGRVSAAEEETGNRFPESEGRVAARTNLRRAMAAKSVNGKQLQPHEIAGKCMGDAYGYGRRSSGLSTAEKELMDAQWKSLKAGVVEALEKAAAEREAEVLEAAAPMATAAAAASALDSVAALKAALPKTIDLGKLVPLIDVSGSMSGTPMEVAIGMGILVSECTHAAFRNRCLTFETKPNWFDLSGCTTIYEKVNKVQSAGWGGSTDFEAACERILMAAEKAKLTPDEVPDLIVFSDMQFNQAGCLRGAADYYNYGRYTSNATWETHYERLERRFAEVGMKVCGSPYAPPKIIFWNLRANTVGFPVEADAPNTMLLSGFSPSLLKLILTGSELGVVVEEEEVVGADGKVKAVKKSGPTPLETVRKALDDSAYDPVRMKLSELESGVLADYSFVREDAGFEMVDVM